MAKKKSVGTKSQKTNAKSVSRFSVSYFKTQFSMWFHKSFWNRLFIGLVTLIMLCIGSMYGIAQWYIHKHANEKMILGATFIADYAKSFDLDPQDTLHAMMDDLGIRDLRLVSYWDQIEATPGTYDFSNLDWQFDMAEQYNAHISLAIGLRQPRWPECHMPGWAMDQPKTMWEQKLKDFIAAVVNHYKDHPMLVSYQLENEFFLKVFGECKDFDRQRLVDEFNLVKQLDPHHQVVVSMSNNAIGTPLYAPTPDTWAISVYKRVWDANVTHRYFEYPIPAWYYAFRAGFTEITRGHNSFIHELQTEAWPAEGKGIQTISIEEQNKSLDANRLRDRIRYGKATGMRRVDLWGVEWWYWRKVKMNDPSLWNVGKEEIKRTNQENQKLNY